MHSIGGGIIDGGGEVLSIGVSICVESSFNDPSRVLLHELHDVTWEHLLKMKIRNRFTFLRFRFNHFGSFKEFSDQKFILHLFSDTLCLLLVEICGNLSEIIQVIVLPELTSVGGIVRKREQRV